MKIVACFAATLMCAASQAGGKTGWSAGFADGDFRLDGVTMEKLNLGSRFMLTRPDGTFTQDAPFSRGDADAENLSYMQFRVWNAAAGTSLAVDFLGATVLKPCHMGFGFFTVPVYGPWTKLPATGDKAPVTGRIGGRGKFVDMSEILLVGERAIDGVYLAATRKDGSPVKAGGVARSGDRMTVRMPVISRPDSLRLSFARLNLGDDPAKVGRREAVSIVTAPPRLEPSPEDPLLYTATFEIPKLAKELKTSEGEFVAVIDYAGVDSRIWGPYYGFAPFRVEFEGGSTDGIPPETLKMFDFGQESSPVMTGAAAVTPRDTPDGFRWISNAGFDRAAFARFLDNLCYDWVKATKSKPAEFEIKVKPGRYKVMFGICPIGVLCYRNMDYKPLETVVSVNGRTAFEKRLRSEKEDLFALMEHEARVDEDVYDTYVRPCFWDVETETDAPDGTIRVKVTMPGESDRKSALLNYAIVYPAGDAGGAEFCRRMLERRRANFFGYFANVSSSTPDWRNALTAKEIPGEGMRLVARENALEWVLPGTMPLLTELGEPLRITAARGERISGGVILNTKTAMKGVELKVEGLPASFKPRILRQMPFWFVHPWNSVYRLGINHLLPAVPRDTEKGVSYGYLLRLDVPGDAKPGVYDGTVVAASADGQTVRLPTRVRIRSVALPPLSDHVIAMLNTDGSSKERMELCRDEIGATAFVVNAGSPKWSFFEYDEDGHPVRWLGPERKGSAGFARAFKDYKEVGFECPVPFVSYMGVGYNEPTPFQAGRISAFTPDYTNALRLTYGKLFEQAREAGFDTVIFDMGGEMGHEAKVPAASAVDGAIRLYKALHEIIPGAMLSYRCNCFTTVDEFYPYLEVQGVRGRTSWEHSDRITDCGRNKWIYTYSKENRFHNGLQSWAHGARGNLREWLTWKHVEEYNNFLCQGSCGSVAHIEMMPGPGRTLVPTLRSEAFRASVVDRKYLRLLENAMKAPRALGGEKAKAESLRMLLKKVVYDHVSDEGSGWSYGTLRGDGNNPWPGVRLDVVRDLCEQFAEALTSGSTTELPDFTPSRSCDYTDFGLADGPIERAGTPALAAFANEKKFDLSNPSKVRAELFDSIGAKIGVYEPGPKDRCLHPSFLIPAKGLKAGTYVLMLRIDGATVAESVFHLL